ncbi:MAG: DUF1330 domain-containing protein [Accumulibacter sp.]|jgi:uncharacterized protein (DUF1330 family)
MAKAYWVTWYSGIGDLSAHARYAALAGPAIEGCGGTFLVRGMSAAAPEGIANERAVVVEFESLRQALAAYNSVEYQAALALLGTAAKREVRFFEAAPSKPPS